MGLLSGTSQLLDAMGEDDEIPGCIKDRVNATVRAPFAFECDDEAAKKLIEENWEDILNVGELFDFLRNFLLEGVAVAVLDWRFDSKVWVPCFRNLPTEFLWHDDSLNVWKYNAKEGEYVVEPGNGTWVLLTSGQRGWLYGYIRALALLWVAKQFVFRDWNRYNERHGMPIIKAKMPVSTGAPEKSKFIQDIQELNSEGVIGLPQGVDGPDVNFDLELLEPKDQSWETFQVALERFDRKINVMLVGGNLGREVASSGANRAASETHDGKLAKLAVPDAQALGECFQYQVVQPFFTFNSPSTTDIPYPCWDAEPPEDLKERALTQETFGKALGALGTAGYKLTEKALKELAETYGLELEEKPPEPPPVVQAMPGAPGQARARVPPQRQLSLASGDTDAALVAQTELDEVADETAGDIQDVMRPDTRMLLRLIKMSTDYDDLKQKIEMSFDQLDPNRLAAVLEKAGVLAALIGRFSVIEEL